MAIEGGVMAVCGAEVSVGDDRGDGDCTFPCKLNKGHSGAHQEMFDTADGNIVAVSWQPKILNDSDGVALFCGLEQDGYGNPYAECDNEHIFVVLKREGYSCKYCPYCGTGV